MIVQDGAKKPRVVHILPFEFAIMIHESFGVHCTWSWIRFVDKNRTGVRWSGPLNWKCCPHRKKVNMQSGRPVPQTRCLTATRGFPTPNRLLWVSWPVDSLAPTAIFGGARMRTICMYCGDFVSGKFEVCCWVLGIKVLEMKAFWELNRSEHIHIYSRVGLFIYLFL